MVAEIVACHGDRKGVGPGHYSVGIAYGYVAVGGPGAHSYLSVDVKFGGGAGGSNTHIAFVQDGHDVGPAVAAAAGS